MKEIPLDDSVAYKHSYPLPACLPGAEDGQHAFVLHPSVFSMDNEASLREPPALDTTEKLLNNFAVDGFESTGEPVLVRMQDSRMHDSGDIPAGSVWFLKGAARVTTAIAAVVACHFTGEQVPEALKKSLACMKCKHIRLADRQQELPLD
ncbi:unnamed protein product [Symbiodinium sp. CCMP2456]|nr:unnamed protein product [Symbiodinium sp. CCMP2456]